MKPMHNWLSFKENGKNKISQCDDCLDVMVVDSNGKQISTHSPCDGALARTGFNIGWTSEDEKRYAPQRAARADIRFNQTATGVQSKR